MNTTILPILMLLLGACPGGRAQSPPGRSSSTEPAHQSVSQGGPGALVTEYIRRDGLGEFQGNSEWLAKNVTFESQGWDQAVVISASRLETTVLEGDTARVRVQYRWVAVVEGDGEGNPRLSRKDSVETVTFTLVHTASRWRIIGPDLASHVLRTTMLKNPRLTPQQRSQLR